MPPFAGMTELAENSTGLGFNWIEQRPDTNPKEKIGKASGLRAYESDKLFQCDYTWSV